VAGIWKKKKRWRESVAECGSCSVCCVDLNIEDLFGKSKFAGVPCESLADRPGGGKHCGAYETRPAVCRNYECDYIKADGRLPDRLRPDNAGIIFTRHYLDWAGMEAYTVIETVASACSTENGVELLNLVRKEADMQKTLMVIMREGEIETATLHGPMGVVATADTNRKLWGVKRPRLCTINEPTRPADEAEGSD
jgi:Fe-S-cluster containining protein